MRAPLDPEVIADCPLEVTLPQTGELTLEQFERYAAALEDSREICRARLRELRRQKRHRADQ